MRRNTNKLGRLLAALLAAATVLSLGAVPADAGRFGDISDKQTSMAADVLSALGVVSGTGGGSFSPEGHLTRAQLCKMAVEAMGMGDQAESQTYRTIFRDMGSGHWARGYVNLAASTEIPAGSGSRLMLGLGDGTFGPDREVTYQETITLLLRLLGYSAEANRAWPHSAVETASQLGLDSGLSVANPAAPVTRGQTAVLFYNMLTTPAKGEETPYAARLGALLDDAIVLATNATVNGESGWVITGRNGGISSYRAAAPVDQSLVGLRGAALLDEEGRFVTLLPDESSYITATVNRKQAYYLHLTDHGRYTMSEDTPVYTGSAADSGVSTYGEYMANIQTGDTVTVYLDKQGKVAGLFRNEASTQAQLVVVRNSWANATTFRILTGEDEHYTIRKNGVTIAMSGIRQYDVATYDPIAKVLDVCDVRLPCIYENAAPTPSSPSQVTAAGGNRFDVMADAMDDFAKLKLGDAITLMFTSNGMVAGVLPEQSAITANALGVLTDDGFRLLGCRLTLTQGVPNVPYRGSLMTASSVSRGVLSLKNAGSYSGASLDTAKMTLGNLQVSPSVQLFEITDDGRLVSRELTRLPDDVTVSQYHRDSVGKVDVIVLRSYSGDGADYGRIDVLDGYVVFNGKDGPVPYDVGGSTFRSGYGTITAINGTVASVNYLRSIPNVSSSAFFTQGGVTYVRTDQGTYEVAEDVQCFNIAASYTWGFNAPPKITKFSSLSECRGFSDKVTIYLDHTGEKVRVVEAN